MTRSARFAMGTALIIGAMVAAGSAEDRPSPDKVVRGRLEGTWEHTFRDAPEHRQVKIINQTHFVWVTYAREDGRPLILAGGTYTFDGTTYKETCEFGGPGLAAEVVGKEQTFSAEIEGDKWTHVGTLSNGFRVREIWSRVK